MVLTFTLSDTMYFSILIVLSSFCISINRMRLIMKSILSHFVWLLDMLDIRDILLVCVYFYLMEEMMYYCLTKKMMDEKMMD